LSTEALNPRIRKREVFGWPVDDWDNSRCTTVVPTAVLAVYFEDRLGHK